MDQEFHHEFHEDSNDTNMKLEELIKNIRAIRIFVSFCAGQEHVQETSLIPRPLLSPKRGEKGRKTPIFALSPPSCVGKGAGGLGSSVMLNLLPDQHTIRVKLLTVLPTKQT